jgi:hypothetical protein
MVQKSLSVTRTAPLSIHVITTDRNVKETFYRITIANFPQATTRLNLRNCSCFTTSNHVNLLLQMTF